MVKLHPLELSCIIIYLVFLLIIGFLKKGSTHNEEDFIVGGRRLTLPAFIATLVTTWYGGILGVGEFTYLYGLSNWIVFGLPYYIFAFIFGIFLASRIQKSHLLSIPDQLYKNYGRTNGIIGTIYTFFITLPAPYVLMVGFMFQFITGWDLWFCIILGTILSMVYVLLGGFNSVVRTDKFQFVLMFGGFIVIFVTLIVKYGGLFFLESKLPETHLTLSGGNSIQYILVWFFIAILTLIDPGFHQRCYAAKNPRTARNGILLSILFWMIFDFLTTSTGLYARALLHNIEAPLSYPILSHQILPPFLSGLFLTGLLATIMSTVDSNFLLSAITIGHDLMAKFKIQKISKLNLTRYGLIISAVISITISLFIPSVVQIWYLFGTLFIPPMLIPVLGSYFRFFRLSPIFTQLNLILPILVSLIFVTASIIISPTISQMNYWLGIQPMYPGLFISLIILVLDKLICADK